MTWLDDLLGVKDLWSDGALLAPRRSALEFVSGTGVALALVDDPATGRSKLTISAAGGSGSADDWRSSVRVATTGALPAYTRVGNVLTANANGALPAIDGVTLTVGARRVFLWHGASGVDNGTYDVTQLGDGSSPWILTRTVDVEGNTETFTDGTRVPIAEGTLYGGRTFKVTTDDPIVLNTTSLTFALDTGLTDGTATYQPLTWNGTTWVGAALNLAQAAAVTGILGVANGGTGIGLGAANTVLHVNAGATAIESTLLTTSNLSASAAIVGTQLAAGANILGSQLSASAAIAASQLASGGANTVLQGGTPNTWTATPTVTSLAATYIALGADPADAGAIRLSHAMGVYGESNTPGTDRAVLTWGVAATDTVTLGDATVPTEIVGSSVGINAAAGTMIEAVEVAAGRRVVSLAFGADLGTTEMPANTGDRVLFIANCATAPTTGDPTSGLIAYGTSGALGLHAAGVTFHERVTLSGITHAARSTDAAATAMVFTPQAPYASATGANRDAVGCTVALSAPAGASIVEAGFDVKRGSNLVCRLGPSPSSPTTLGAMWLGGALTASATNYCVASTSTYTIINAPGGSDTVYLRAGHSTNLFAANTTEITPYIAAIAWPSTVTAPTLKQATHATTPQTMTLQAMNVTTGTGSQLALKAGTGSVAGGIVSVEGHNFSLFDATGSFGSGVGVLFGKTYTTIPTTAPSGGGLVYWDGDGNIFGVNEAGIHVQLN